MGESCRDAGRAGVVITLAGCSSDPSTQVELTAKNRMKWTLPLDPYGERAIDHFGVAASLLQQKCADKKGYHLIVVTDALRVGRGESWSPAGLKLFDERLADRYGYGNSPISDLSVEAEQRARHAEESNKKIYEVGRAALDACWKEAAEALGRPGHDGTDAPTWFANQLAIQASHVAMKSKRVTDGIAAWHACMVKTGIPGITDSPVAMPGDSVPSTGPAIDPIHDPADRFNVPDQERRVAIADAKCRESSGYSKALYEAQWNAEARALRANADQLERSRAAQAKLDEKVDAIIAKHAPSAG